MTLGQYEKRLKSINPKLRLRKRNYGDIVGVYLGDKYLGIRLNYGEIWLNGYRLQWFNHRMETVQGGIRKRGRKTITKLLQNQGIVKTLKQRSMLLWGL